MAAKKRILVKAALPQIHMATRKRKQTFQALKISDQTMTEEEKNIPETEEEVTKKVIKFGVQTIVKKVRPNEQRQTEPEETDKENVNKSRNDRKREERMITRVNKNTDKTDKGADAKIVEGRQSNEQQEIQMKTKEEKSIDKIEEEVMRKVLGKFRKETQKKLGHVILA